MGRTKASKKCNFKGCKNPKKLDKRGYIKSSFCSTHQHKATINGFLVKLYQHMKDRVRGTEKGRIANRVRKYYLGKAILPRDVFMQWAKNHPDFLSLYKRYVTSDFDRRLAPSVNRMNSNKGYILNNMEWMTFSQNAGLAGSVKKMNNSQRKVIYEVLGVKQ